MISQEMGEITTVSKASSKFESVRTTIPRSIVKQWKLIEGDKIEWDWQAHDNEMILIVRKVQSSKDTTMEEVKSKWKKSDRSIKKLARVVRENLDYSPEEKK